MNAKQLFKIVIISLGISTPSVLSAKTKSVNCWEAAGNKYSVDPLLLYSIAQRESSLNPKITSAKNSDGTYDIGMMQINSTHLKTLKKYGIKEKDLYNACLNIFVGAWILSDSIRSMGPSWRAVGAYNAGVKDDPKREKLRKAYADKVFRIYSRNLRMHKLTVASSD